MNTILWLTAGLAWGGGTAWLSRDRGSGLVERTRNRVKVNVAWSLFTAAFGLFNAVLVAHGYRQTYNTICAVWMFGAASLCWREANRLRGLLNHPLIYLVALRDTFGGE